MESTVVFRIIGDSLNYSTGQTICFDDGTEGRITSIREIRHLGGINYEIIGRYKPYKFN